MSRRPYLPFVLALCVLCPEFIVHRSSFIVSECFAAKVKVWHHSTPAHHEKAERKGVVLSSEGTLRLARHLKPLAALDATHVWDLAEDGAGNLYAATGGEGRVYKVGPDGKATAVYAADGSQVLCLAVGPDNAVYAGTGPGGHVVRIDPQGGAKILCDTGESYVWSLAYAPKAQALYAGTGPKGRVYRVTPDGKPTLFYSTKQEHVLCVAAGEDGSVYAGTDKGGLVYRVDAKGKGFVLHQAAQAEVRSLKVTPEGVYAGTSAPTRRRTGGPAPAGEGKESGKAGPAPASGENSVYRIAPDGTAREVFREKALVLSLLRQDGRLYVGTGMEGQLFEADEATRERSEIARLDHGQILSLCRRRDGSTVLGTGDPGKLYALQDRHVAKGTATSEVLDARLVSRWGSLRWEADTPPGTAVTVAVRSGNVAEPDETWSDWSAEQADPQQAVLDAPAARFLQYRLTLTTANPGVSPAVRTVSLRYATANQAPEVTKVEVPDLNAVNLEHPKKLRVKWSATDANDDDLTYAVLVRKEGWKNWVQLEDDLEKADFDWDTTTTPSGVYRVKVVASDRKDNPDGDALTGERTSVPFVVCHEAPAVQVKVVGMAHDRAVLEATAASPLVRLTAASFAVNGKKWTNVFPSDGLFDSKSESFRFTTEALKPGSYVLVLRVRDAAGNTGSADAVFRVEGPAARK